MRVPSFSLQNEMTYLHESGQLASVIAASSLAIFVTIRLFQGIRHMKLHAIPATATIWKKVLIRLFDKKIATEEIMALKAITEIALATNRDPINNHQQSDCPKKKA